MSEVAQANVAMTLTVTAADVEGSAANVQALVGTTIAIPAGALSQATNIQIFATSETVAPNGTAAAGPVIELEPSPLAFDQPVTITIPITATGAAPIAIQAIERDGSGRQIAATLANGFATFQTSSFTAFGGIVLSGDAGTGASSSTGLSTASGTSSGVASTTTSGTTSGAAGTSGSLCGATATSSTSGESSCSAGFEGFVDAGSYAVVQNEELAATVVGDFNGDGKLDIVVSNGFSFNGGPSGNTVGVLLNQGGGTFAGEVQYTTGPSPGGLAAADFNGDGALDLAVTNSGTADELNPPVGNTVSVLLGHGDGSFAAQATYAVGNTPYGVAAADFNGDGKPDLAVASTGSPLFDGGFEGDGGFLNGGSVSVLMNNGDGTFADQVPYGLGGPSGAVAIVAADFNGDCRPDLAVANANGGLSVLLNLGAGLFGAPVSFAGGTSPSSLVAADFNGDGKIDLALANSLGTDQGSVQVLLGNGDGTFGLPAIYPVSSAPQSLTVADFDGDGRPDLSVANYNDGTVGVLLNTGNGTFSPQVITTLSPFIPTLASGDFNGDGKPDLVFGEIESNGDGQLSILLSVCN